jgi:Flp pilus assembly protein CpaB
MNLLAIIVVFLALATAGAIAYIAWELSSDQRGGKTTDQSAADLEEPPES